MSESTLSSERLRSAFETASRELLSRRSPNGHWTGRLSASALSTATAVSAMSIFRNALRENPSDETGFTPEILERSIHRGVAWLLERQNPDGGWGDTDKSFSNISTTILVKSALILSETETNRFDTSRDVSSRTDAYIERQGGLNAVRSRYGKDQTFSVPILTNAALAGLVPWKEVPQLPFERAAMPRSMFRLLNLQVVSYAIPALVAIGQVRFHFYRSRFNPLGNFLRRRAVGPTLRLIDEMQPESGGYLEAAPLTAFVAMSLSACGHRDHPVVRRCIRFLLDTVREDGSWPIDTNLATWGTTLSINALGVETLSKEPEMKRLENEPEMKRSAISGYTDWLLSCQHRKKHPFTGADPGGWGWTDLSGAVPDGDDTPGALLALAELWPTVKEPEKRREIIDAAESGIRWLLKLQNRDGGMPTFCRGWGILPFDQSSTDLSAHALLAFALWTRIGLEKPYTFNAVFKMIAFLQKTQRKDGSWLPLWFGNQHQPDDVNPFYGTARVLRALDVCDRTFVRLDVFDPKGTMIRKGLDWIIANQNVDGAWGGDGTTGSVEETAVIMETLAAFQTEREDVSAAYRRGLSWLVDAVESGRFTESSPIGLYFAKLWYYEDLYPIIFTTAALRAALQRASDTQRAPDVSPGVSRQGD